MAKSQRSGFQNSSNTTALKIEKLIQFYEQIEAYSSDY